MQYYKNIQSRLNEKKQKHKTEVLTIILKILNTIFTVRQHITFAYRATCHRSTGRTSVCHTGGSVKNGWYDYYEIFTLC